MEKVSIEDVEPRSLSGDIDRRGLSDPLGTEDVAINRYRLDPGERFSSALHTHMDQEEVFVVVEGEATFETPEREVTVAAGEAIRFAPGEYQSGKNDGEGVLVAFGIGAPRHSRDVRVPRECPECGHENVQAIPDDDGMRLVCPGCKAELAES
jgi:uncharacterized cupin superfamily protein